MKTAIVGDSGYIAQFIARRFAEEPKIDSVLKIGRRETSDAYLDLARANIFDYSLLNDLDFIVFTAAISGPDQCAKEYDACWNINVTGTGHFIKEALNRNCKVLFFSSDAVFGDIPGAIYDENSATQALTPYGKMKKAIEDEFKDFQNFKALRLSYVASSKDKFIKYCLNCIQTGETADIFHPFYRNVTVVSDVVDIVFYLALHWAEYEPTFLNVAGKELVSRLRIADEINRVLGGKLYYSVSRPGADFFANRPQITQMRSLYLSKYGIVKDNTFSEKISKELEGVEI